MKSAGEATAKAKMGVIPGLRNITHFNILTSAMETALMNIRRGKPDLAAAGLEAALQDNQAVIDYHAKQDSV